MLTNKITMIQGDCPALCFGLNRINVDHITAMTLLKYPEFWPNNWDHFHLSELQDLIFDFVDNLYYQQNHHVLLAEYAQSLLEREVQLIHGYILKVDWLRTAIIALHKNQSQNIILIN